MANRQRRSGAGIGICVFFLLGSLCIGMAGANVSLETYHDGIQVSEVEKGHEFLVRVYVSNTNDLYGSAFDLIYNPQVLRILDSTPHVERIQPKITEGDVLNEGRTVETLLLSALEDGQAGKVSVGVSRKGPIDGVDVGDSHSLLLTVHFQAVEPSAEATNITFALHGLRDSTISTIHVDTWEGAGVTVLDLIIRKLDLNDDEVIDLKDLILAMQVQTRQPLAEPVHELAEFSGDGIIGMAEAVGIMQVLGELRSPPQ